MYEEGDAVKKVSMLSINYNYDNQIISAQIRLDLYSQTVLKDE
jgi:hypothetical protein